MIYFRNKKDQLVLQICINLHLKWAENKNGNVQQKRDRKSAENFFKAQSKRRMTQYLIS